MLVSAYPNLARTEVSLFSTMLVDDMAAARPSKFELAQACRKVRAKHEFLSVAAVMKELAHQREQAGSIRYLLWGSRAPLREVPRQQQLQLQQPENRP
jgi:hypothetical protein